MLTTLPPEQEELVSEQGNGAVVDARDDERKMPLFEANGQKLWREEKFSLAKTSSDVYNL